MAVAVALTPRIDVDSVKRLLDSSMAPVRLEPGQSHEIRVLVDIARLYVGLGLARDAVRAGEGDVAESSISIEETNALLHRHRLPIDPPLAIQTILGNATFYGV